jgi:hypothetical protein
MVPCRPSSGEPAGIRRQNVPAIKPKADDNGSGNVKELTMRQQMDAHHTNPVCATCHRIFEPIGLAMENYDAIGQWRTQVDGTPIDATGTLVDGTQVDGVVSLRNVLVRYQDQSRGSSPRSC